jgi:TrmH family RNA methyltransferase
LADLISSPQNPKIKNIVQLIEKSSERKKQQLMVLEGRRELQMALHAGFMVDSLFVCQELNNDDDFINSLSLSGNMVFEVSKAVFGKIALRENSDGLIALLKPVYLGLADLKLRQDPLIIVLESVEKPGNLGAILRTADAASADAVIICDPRTDIYNPNCIRSSVGCIFTNQVVTASSEEVLNWLRNKKINCYAAALTAQKYYHETDLKSPIALVMGTEADGLTDFWLNNCDAQIKIPMLGKIDSLNVSASAAILVFEAMRQRNFNVD